MAIHLEDLPVASPVIAQEAAGRLEKVVHPKNAGAGLHHFKSSLTGRKKEMFL
jgi:hypothetical protein